MRKFDAVEVALIALVVAGLIVGLFEITTPAPVVNGELEQFAKKYGPHHHSTNAEEWMIRDFFQDRRDGTFVDVGAYEYERFSNTYYLETVLDWSGLAIEPQRQYEADWRRFRARSRFLPFFVSDASNAEGHLYVTERNRSVTSASRDFTAQWSHGEKVRELTAPTITLNDLLMAEHIDHFDFLTIDIELGEPKALAGFNIEHFRPALVCIEAQPQVRQSILDYFVAHHYVIVGKYLRAEPFNLYFTPTIGQATR